MTCRTNRGRQVRLLQSLVAILALVPVCAGFAGAAYGIGIFQAGVPLGQDTDSTGRYLSGLLLAIGIAYWTTVPRIETQGVRFRLLTLLVFTGGLARLAGMVLVGLPSIAMLGALVMELIVTPVLALWRERVDGPLREVACADDTGYNRCASRKERTRWT